VPCNNSIQLKPQRTGDFPGTSCFKLVITSHASHLKQWKGLPVRLGFCRCRLSSCNINSSTLCSVLNSRPARPAVSGGHGLMEQPGWLFGLQSTNWKVRKL
jgi:hypothetical protein